MQAGTWSSCLRNSSPLMPGISISRKSTSGGDVAAKANRFEKAMSRLQNFLEIHFKAGLLDFTLGEDTLFIKDGHDHIKLHLYEIIYLEALKDYTGIVTRHKKYCVLTPLGSLLKEKTFQTFIRIHRSYAVQKHYINKITPKEVLVSNQVLPVGRSYKNELDKLLTS